MKVGIRRITLVVNIADFLVKRYSKHVLFVDVGSQSNATRCLLNEKE